MPMRLRLRLRLRLISHKLCPYVQRAVIVAAEKRITFERVDIDLADKPAWFVEMSPTGKVPLLEVTEPNGTAHTLFESAVIAEFIDELTRERLLPSKPVERATERAWVEFASATLSDVGKLYSAMDKERFEEAAGALQKRLSQVEAQIAEPWFSGSAFGLVDAAFGPMFRYLDVFARRGSIEILSQFPRTAAWAARLLSRESVRSAVSTDYEHRLVEFVARRGSWLGQRLTEAATPVVQAREAPAIGAAWRSQKVPFEALAPVR